MNTFLNILIVGGDGMIGSKMYDFFSSQNYNVYKTTRRNKKVSDNTFFLDFKDIDKLNVKNINFDYIVFCAAETSIKFCEENVEESYLINVASIKLITAKFSKSNFVFLSSNSVFGDCTYIPKIQTIKNPNTIYGLHKHKIEQFFISKYPQKSIILRMTKVIDQNFYLFHEWLSAHKNKKIVSPFDDYYFAPLYVDDVVYAVKELIDFKKIGLHHLSPDKQISYYDSLQFLFKKAGFETSSIIPISCSGMGLKGKNISLISNSKYRLKKLNDISVYNSIECFLEKNYELLIRKII